MEIIENIAFFMAILGALLMINGLLIFLIVTSL